MRKLKYVGGMVTISSAAKTLGVSRPTIYRWLNTGKLTGTTFGGVIFIDSKQVDKLKETP
jgi:excisionase family DNA binding protein